MIGVAGFVVPGSHVDVLVTLANKVAGDKESSTTRMVVSNVQVLTAGTRFDQDKAQEEGKAIPSTVVTLEVTPDDAERIALAQNQGQITLTLRNPLVRFRRRRRASCSRTCSASRPRRRPRPMRRRSIGRAPWSSLRPPWSPPRSRSAYRGNHSRRQALRGGRFDDSPPSLSSRRRAGTIASAMAWTSAAHAATPTAHARPALAVAGGWTGHAPAGLSALASRRTVERDRIPLTAGRSTVLGVDFDVVRVAITDPKIADALVVQPREVLVNGIGVGTTSLIVWGKDSRRRVRRRGRVRASPRWSSSSSWSFRARTSTSPARTMP